MSICSSILPLFSKFSMFYFFLTMAPIVGLFLYLLIPGDWSHVSTRCSHSSLLSYDVFFLLKNSVHQRFLETSVLWQSNTKHDVYFTFSPLVFPLGAKMFYIFQYPNSKLMKSIVHLHNWFKWRWSCSKEMLLLSYCIYQELLKFSCLLIISPFKYKY